MTEFQRNYRQFIFQFCILKTIQVVEGKQSMEAKVDSTITTRFSKMLATLYLAVIYLATASSIPCSDSYILVLFSTEEETSSLVEGILRDLTISDIVNDSQKSLSQTKINGTSKTIFSLRTESIHIDFLNIWGPYKEDIYVSWSYLINLGIHLKKCQVTIVGPSRSDFTYSVALFTMRSNLSLQHFHISPLSTSNIPGSVVGTFESLVPSSDLLADASVALLRLAQWSHVLALYEDSDMDLTHSFMRFQNNTEILDSERKQSDTDQMDGSCERISNRTLGSSIIVNFDGHIHVNQLLSHPIQIIFLFLNPRLARRALCELRFYRQKPYQFIIVKTTFKEILSQADDGECSRSEIAEVLVEAIVVGYNTTQEQFENNYRNGIFIVTENHTYEVPPLSIVQRMVGQSDHVLALYFSNHSLTEKNKIRFISSDFTKVFRFVGAVGFGISLSAILLLVTATVLTHVLIIKHWDSKPIRAIGVKVQQLSFISIYELIASLLVASVNKSFNLGTVRLYFCIIYYVLAGGAITLLLSALAMHHWRLYRIFKHYLKPGDMLSNRSLILISAILGAFPVLVCVVWIAIERPIQYESSCTMDSKRFIVEATVTCKYKYWYYFFSLFLVFGAILIVIIFGLNWLTRNAIPKSQINFRHSNTSLLLYSFVFIFIVGYTVYFIAYLINNIWLEFLSVIFSPFLAIVVFLSFIFVYPLYYAMKKK